MAHLIVKDTLEQELKERLWEKHYNYIEHSIIEIVDEHFEAGKEFALQQQLIPINCMTCRFHTGRGEKIVCPSCHWCSAGGRDNWGWNGKRVVAEKQEYWKKVESCSKPDIVEPEKSKVCKCGEGTIPQKKEMCDICEFVEMLEMEGKRT
jgi:hypothetical protein